MAPINYRITAGPPLGKERLIMRFAGALVCLFVFMMASGKATITAAGVIAESGDAGQTLSGFQDTTSSGVIDSITGTFSTGTDADLYLIYISDPANFSASAPGAVGFDPQLFLFGADGKAVIANDDDTGPGGIVFGSSLLPIGSVGSLPAGNYLLGISLWDVDPVDSTNAELFEDSFSGIAQPNTTTTLAGFDTNYRGAPVTTPLPYTIVLTGTGIAAATVPEPSTFFIMASGLALLYCGKRRRYAAL